LPYKDPKKKRDANARYRKKHHEKILEKQRKFSKKNPDYQKRQYTKHSEKWNQNRREKYQNNDEYKIKRQEQSKKTREKYCAKYNRNRGLKLNPNYQQRPDRRNFVCECGSTIYYCKGYCKSCAHKKLGYGKKYEKIHKKERKISRMNNPQWQKKAYENYSQKFCNMLQMTALEITMKWRKVKKECLVRDNFTCQICGETEYLQVHHIIHKSKKQGLFFNNNNLITLCEKRCHKDVHGKKLNEKNSISFHQGIKMT